jgi:hypothetical protein
MYRNLESTYGRVANDLGTQRKLTDKLLDLKRETDLGKSAPTIPKVDIKSSDLLDNPSETLERVLATREAAQAEAQSQRIAQLESQMAAQAFIQKHPDYQQFAGNDEFAQWVKASPIRQRAANAAQQGDWGAAGDLLSEYKDSTSRKPASQDDGKSDELEAARNATTERTSQGNDTGKKKGKIYLRRDLMQLRATNPDKYYDEDFQEEILRAYNENRVK